MKCMKNEGLEKHTIGEMIKLGQNPSGEDEKSEKIMFRVREISFLSREKERNEI